MKKDVLVLGVGRALQMLLLFANYRLLTMVLPKNEVGQYFFILSLTAITGLIFVNPLGTWFNRTLHSFEDVLKLRIQMLLVFFAILVLSFLNFPIVWLLSSQFESLGSSWVSVAGLVTFYVASTSINNTLVPVFNFLKQRTLFVVLTVASQGLALFWAWFLGSKAELASSWMIGHGIGFATFAVLAMVFPVRPVKSTTVKLIPMPLFSANAWRFAWPVAVVNIAIWSMTQGYRPFLEKFAGLEVLAVVGLGLGLASAMGVAFEYLIQQIYQPDFYESAHSDSESAWRKLAFKSFRHYADFCLFLVVIAPFLLPLLADQKFKDAAIFLVLGTLVEMFRMSTNLMALKAHGDMKTRVLRWPYIGAIVLLFVLLSGMIAFQFFSSYLVVGSLLAAYLVLFLKLKKRLSIELVDLWPFSMHKAGWPWLTLVYILALWVPKSWSESLMACIGVCAVFGTVFLLRQYRLYLVLNSEEMDQ